MKSNRYHVLIEVQRFLNDLTNKLPKREKVGLRTLAERTPPEVRIKKTKPESKTIPKLDVTPLQEKPKRSTEPGYEQ